MPPKNPDGLEKGTHNFRAGDLDYLKQHNSSIGIPVTHTIRTIVSEHVDFLREQEAKQIANLKTDNIDV
jgi:hypothetical protein